MNSELITFLEEEAKELEKNRKKALRKHYLYIPLDILRSLSFIAFAGLAIVGFFAPLLWIPLIGTLVLAFLLTVIIRYPLEELSDQIYKVVLPRVFKKINSSFEYKRYGFNRGLLEDSGFLTKRLFSKSISIYGEDDIKGTIEGVNVEFFEVRFYKEIIRYWLTLGGCLLTLVLIPILIFLAIFKGVPFDEIPFFGIIKKSKKYLSGLFMYADFHKDFRGKVLMIPKKEDTAFDRIYEVFDAKEFTEISVENSYVNDNYNIYVTNVQLGYYVLSQSFIDSIYKMSTEENAMPIISLKNGKMYFLIPWEKDYFEIKSFSRKIIGADYFLKHIKEIDSFEKIIKDFNLDTRIWSKI